MKKKRHHHYVWRYYLRSWASEEKIACLMDGKIFEPNLMGIGQEKDFYKLRELNSNEIEFLMKFIDASRKHLQILHKDLMLQFTSIFLIRQQMKISGEDDQELNKLLDIAIHNLEESFHTDIENTAKEYIQSILREDIEFYNTDKGCREFIYFLSVQYLRTKKIRKSTAERLADIPTIDFEKISVILDHMIAINVGWVLYAERKQFRMILLKNATAKEFITGDQPVINTYSIIGESKAPPDEIELYYPISPKLAILISEKEEFKGRSLQMLNEKDVKSYNDLIVKNSDTQIYATSKNFLEEYI